MQEEIQKEPKEICIGYDLEPAYSWAYEIKDKEMSAFRQKKSHQKKMGSSFRGSIHLKFDQSLERAVIEIGQ
jgi:isocitrate lyase